MKTNVKTVMILGAWITLPLVSVPASADEKAACLDAASQGQTLRDAHKLVEAREQFRACARATCPAVVQTDCVTWVNEADKALPTVVFSAKDTSGNDVFDVSVSLDGVRLAAKLEGVAIPVNPGAHTFRFQRADGSEAERQVLVPEGQRDVVVAVSLHPAAAPSPAPPAAPPAIGAGPGPASPSSSPLMVSPPEGGGARAPWHTIGWVVGGAGAVGLGVGTVFGLVALSKKSAAECDATGSCAQYGSVNDAKSAATVSTVGFVAGGVLLAGGAALLLFTHPSHDASADSRSADLRAVPMVSLTGGGLSLEGTW